MRNIQDTFLCDVVLNFQDKMEMMGVTSGMVVEWNLDGRATSASVPVPD